MNPIFCLTPAMKTFILKTPSDKALFYLAYEFKKSISYTFGNTIRIKVVNQKQDANVKNCGTENSRKYGFQTRNTQEENKQVFSRQHCLRSQEMPSYIAFYTILSVVFTNIHLYSGKMYFIKSKM